MGCCVATVGGRSAASGSAAPLDQGFVIQGLVDPGLMASAPAEALVTVWAGATVQLGSVPIASYLTRLDDPVLGTTLRLDQAGIYSIVASVALPTTGTAGLVVAPGVDNTAAQRSGAAGNPEPWFPEVAGNDFRTGWPGVGGEARPIHGRGELYITEAMASSPVLGIVRVLLSNAAAAPPTIFDTIPGIAYIRCRRIADAGE